MTNAELNLAIAKLVYAKVTVTQHAEDCVYAYGYSWDYCNNWDDLMPLVIEHDISFTMSTTDGFIADTYVADDKAIGGRYVAAKNKNPQRALAMCLLKVLESKDE